MSIRLSLGLVHHPVVDRLGTTVATNVTNYDIHDIARACQVFGVTNYYIITPMKEQLSFVARVLEHWNVGYGAKFNPMRRTALSPVKTVESIEEAIRDWGANTCVIGTSAREVCAEKLIGFNQLKSKLNEVNQRKDQQSYMLLFGTGFGLHESVLKRCDLVLEPIRGRPPKDYRHLSVRSAVSICLDRLLGTW
ncbi:MAG: RNA methyltransferase [Pseudomonadota bacterium]|nr:RNA methyltransferase [Pseudomonadota bacterium]